MITLEKLNLYDTYEGNEDVVLRRSQESDKELIESGDWYRISNFLQDIELIEKGLASKSFIANVIEQLKMQCDEAAYNRLRSRIFFIG